MMLSGCRPALLIVDVQRDFCVGGALEIPDGNRVIPPLNQLIHAFATAERPIYASRDWHPHESVHFASHGGQWPVHCVAGTRGAQFHDDLALPGAAVVVTKGEAPTADGYSAFEGRTGSGTLFGEALTRQRVTHLYVGGLATDYCVLQSVLDARSLGFDVTVVADALAGVELTPGDINRSLVQMQAAGAAVVSSRDVASQLCP